MIDRIAPTIRPDRPVRGYQQWRSLLFLHWPVPIDLLRAVVPASLEIDTWNGEAYVGVVPFAMQGVRNASWPKWAGMTFLETNVRTYVHTGGKPGVYFLSLDAASRLAVWGARTFWGLPYFYADMRLEQDGEKVLYTMTRRHSEARLHVRYRIGADLGASMPETSEHFFLERYLLFLEYRGKLYSGQVHHAAYPAKAAEVLELEQTMIEAGGLGAINDRPTFAHYSPGVDVEVFGLTSCDE